MSAPLVSFSDLREFARSCYTRAGVAEEEAAIGAEVLATTDAWGVFTHGTKLLAGYLKRLRAGGLHPSGSPKVVREGGAWVVFDGNSTLAHPTSVKAMQWAIQRARIHGLAYAGLRNSCHFGAAGYYAWLAAREGLIGVAMANDIPSVAAPGSRGAVTGSNPLAYAIPARRHDPILLDMSIAKVAGGKVFAARARGEPIPGDWIIGADGCPTSDPSRFPMEGALLPMAGHKGYGLALLIESLSALLTGASMTWGVRSWSHHDPGLPTLHGAAFLAMDPAVLAVEGDFAERVSSLIDEIHASPRADGVERLYVPGEIEWERYRQQIAEGIALPPDVIPPLREAAALSGLASVV